MIFVPEIEILILEYLYSSTEYEDLFFHENKGIEYLNLWPNFFGTSWYHHYQHAFHNDLAFSKQDTLIFQIIKQYLNKKQFKRADDLFYYCCCAIRKQVIHYFLQYKDFMQCSSITEIYNRKDTFCYGSGDYAGNKKVS